MFVSKEIELFVNFINDSEFYFMDNELTNIHDIYVNYSRLISIIDNFIVIRRKDYKLYEIPMDLGNFIFSMMEILSSCTSLEVCVNRVLMPYLMSDLMSDLSNE